MRKKLQAKVQECIGGWKANTILSVQKKKTLSTNLVYNLLHEHVCYMYMYVHATLYIL